MTAVQNLSITNLLDAWRNHDDRRRNGASIPDLVDSRRLLEEARLQTRASLR